MFNANGVHLFIALYQVCLLWIVTAFFLGRRQERLSKEILRLNVQ